MDKTTWLYDEATGLLTNKVYADHKGHSYTYTPDGKLAARIWARPQPGTTNQELRTSYAYDSCCGAMTNIDYSDSTPDVVFTFNRLGQQVSVTDGQGTRSFTYNDQLQLASETNVMGVITRQYDGLGRSSGFSLGTDHAVAYGYDNAGRFLTLTSMLSALSSNTFTYSYLANSDSPTPTCSPAGRMAQ